MTLKRRTFLGMIGGAFAAPLMPSASLGAATKVAYPASAFHGAIYFAQNRLNFSVFTLAQRIGVSMDQAEAVMVDMSKRGILGPMQGGNAISGRWATSHLKSRELAKAATARKLARTEHKAARSEEDSSKADSKGPWADLRPFLSHLQDLCRAQGRALHPRCAELV